MKDSAAQFTLRPHSLTRRGRSAFTLLEVIAALTMTSVLLLAVYSSLSVAFRARRSAQRKVEPMRRLALTMELLRADLESAVPPTGLLANECLGDDGGADGDDRDALLFFAVSANTPWPDHPAGLRRIEYIVETDEATDQPTLFRLTTRNANAPVLREPQREVLCLGAAQFNLRYFDGADWVDSWDSQSYDGALPRAIEITLALTNGEASSDDEKQPVMTTVVAIPTGGELTVEGQGGQVIR